METKKLKLDIIVMTILMILSGLFYYFFIPAQIPLSAMFTGNTSFSSRTFPNVIAVALFAIAGLSLVKSISGLVKARRSQVPSVEKAGGTGPRGVAAILPRVIPYIVYLLIVLYCFLFEAIGYVAATIIVPPFLMLLLGCRNWKYYAYMYAFGALLYMIFKLGLRIPMP